MKYFKVYILIQLFANMALQAQNPHGDSFKADCNSCHTSESWEVDFRNTGFQHDTTGFILDGQHSETSCISCHETLVFSAAPNQCASCHTDVHSMTVGNDCIRCHTTETWLVDIIPELHEQNGFPLFGVHDQISCAECHTSQNTLQWNRVGGECADCHMADFQATTEPNHIESGFSTECIECHLPTTEVWSPGGLFHDFFPLTQGHDIADCNECHTPGTYEGLSSECVDCHLKDYNNTINPNHQAANFGMNCASCHSTLPGWSPTTMGGEIFHDFFPLTGGHNIQDCAECHNTNDYSDISSECISCHVEDFNRTENPDHLRANFGTSCTDCHTTDIGWKSTLGGDGEFHSSFPLTLGHDISTCIECHTSGEYTAISNECSTCHQTDYLNTTNPNHTEVNIGTDCINCHTTNPGWMPADFPSSLHTQFPLTGVHNISSCTECHNTGSYADASSECVSCHIDDYNQTSDPNHSSSGFNTDCASCHSTSSGWTPASFRDHDSQYFPIYRGNHRGEWNSCFECHVDQTYDTFSCIDCHEHRQSKMDDEHRGRRNYVYESNACFACHPDGDD